MIYKRTLILMISFLLLSCSRSYEQENNNYFFNFFNVENKTEEKYALNSSFLHDAYIEDTELKNYLILIGNGNGGEYRYFFANLNENKCFCISFNWNFNKFFSNYLTCYFTCKKFERNESIDLIYKIRNDVVNSSEYRIINFYYDEEIVASLMVKKPTMNKNKLISFCQNQFSYRE
ncbi:MAG: hypothetical protein IJ656_03015 [Bacilli bacterium]|nr:hypothetical protein [Bacilli bacterium]MBR1581982.1 hypothetical protein [Bacilli bacterium]